MWRTFERSEFDPTLSGDNLVTKMNEKIRSRLPKPEWKKILKRITKSDKVAIAKEYDKRLKKESREDILEDLASKWDRSTRRIESHVSEGRQMITYEKQAAESKRIQTDVLKEQVKKHFDELAEAYLRLDKLRHPSFLSRIWRATANFFRRLFRRRPKRR